MRAQWIRRCTNYAYSAGTNGTSVQRVAELLRHEAVTDAAIVGVADEKWGEVPIVFLVVKAEHKVALTIWLHSLANA